MTDPLDRATATGASRRERAAALLDLVRGAGRRLGTPGGLGDLVERAAQQVRVRSLLELQQAHGGATGRALAEALTDQAARVAAAIGAAAGAAATASEAAPPLLLSAPVLLGAETLATTAVELRLVAELHVALGRPLPPAGQARAAALLRVWATGRGLGGDDLAALAVGGGGLAGLVGRVARRRVRRRIAHRLAGSSLSFLPALAGAAVSAQVNSRATRRLGDTLTADLLA